MNKRFCFTVGIIVFLVSLILLTTGCSPEIIKNITGQNITGIAEKEVVSKCIALCKEKKTTIDLNKGPCLSNNITEAWVCDAVHSPRIASDNLPENTCSAFGVSARSFVEVDADCKLISVYSPAPKVTPSAEKSKTISSPHGFAVAVPAGYEMSVSDSGIVEVSKEDSTVIIDPVIVSEEKSGAQILNDVIPLIKQIVGDIEITSVEQLPDYPDSYVATVKYSNKVGAILVTLKGTKGFIAGMFDDKNKYNASVKDMTKIIDSFEYKNELKQPEAVGATTLKTWKDPKEGAFTIEVPEGWTMSSDSGIARPYLDASVKIVLAKGDSGISIEQLHPPLYYTPNWVLQMSGFNEGSKYMDGIVLSYHTASQYIQNVVPEQFGFSAPVSVKERSDLVAGTYHAPWIKETTAAEASFVEAKNKKKVVHNIVVSVEYYELSGVGMWAVGLVHYWAPEDEIESVAKLADKVMGSVKVDESWAKREQQEVAKRTGAINAMGDDISKTIKSAFAYRDEVMDKTSKQFSNALLGVNDVYDPETGQQYTVPNDAEYIWKYFDTLISTETDTNPLNDPNVKKLYCPYC